MIIDIYKDRISIDEKKISRNWKKLLRRMQIKNLLSYLKLFFQKKGGIWKKI